MSVRKALVSGVDQVADMVKLTLGPRGKNIVIERRGAYPLITRDGVTVAKYISLSDAQENLGAKLCKEAAAQTNDLVGDGTTTSIVLAQAMAKGGLSLVEAGLDPMQFKKGIERAVDYAVAEIQRLSVPVTVPDGVCQVASVSSKSTPVGELIAQAMAKVGPDGTISVEESIERHTYVEVTEGLELNSGYMSSYFLNEGEELMVSLANPYILITDYTLKEISEVKRTLNLCAWEIRPLFFIAGNMTKDVLGMLIAHNKANQEKVVVVKTPSHGDDRQGIMEDLAIVTGGSVITKKLGMVLNSIEKPMLGKSQKVVVTRYKTTILGGAGTAEGIQEQVRKLKVILGQTSDSEEGAQLKQRISALAGGIAVIRVGADTHIALKELKDRVIDAVHAAKAAVESGVVPGGGTVFIRAAQALDKVPVSTDYEKAGIKLVQRALEAPLQQIVSNSGGNGKKIVAMTKTLGYDMGYDALSGKFVDWAAAGIVDPAKVSVTALRNAMGIASILLTTEGKIEKFR
uniref:60 kDa chaperonin n=1 Tax=Desulfitobacterium dehalogenans TaxID=36854 RepID=Q9XD06_9FIRM|nr:GroEL-type chaperonin [Desulfitobacterium dehalogenans ATCC 51507]